MKQLTEAIYAQLSGLYGAENVYAGLATDATVPYVTYTLQGSGQAEYHTSDHNQGTITPYPVMISVWTHSYTTAISRIEEIIEAFENTFPSMQNDKCVNVEKISESVEQDYEQEETGPIVWRGICVIEFSVARGR